MVEGEGESGEEVAGWGGGGVVRREGGGVLERTSLGSMISERRVRRRGGAGRVMIGAGELGCGVVVVVVVVVEVEVDAPRDVVGGVMGEMGEMGALEVEMVLVLVVMVILRGESESESAGLEPVVGLDCFWPIVVEWLRR